MLLPSDLLPQSDRQASLSCSQKSGSSRTGSLFGQHYSTTLDPILMRAEKAEFSELVVALAHIDPGVGLKEGLPRNS